MLKYLAVRNVVISILELGSYRKFYRLGNLKSEEKLQQISSHDSYECVESNFSFAEVQIRGLFHMHH